MLCAHARPIFLIWFIHAPGGSGIVGPWGSSTYRDMSLHQSTPSSKPNIATQPPSLQSVVSRIFRTFDQATASVCANSPPLRADACIPAAARCGGGAVGYGSICPTCTISPITANETHARTMIQSASLTMACDFRGQATRGRTEPRGYMCSASITILADRDRLRSSARIAIVATARRKH